MSDDVSPEVRRLVYDRDGWKCRYCGDDDPANLTVHHVVYRSQGGTHDPDNLITLCWTSCHRRVHEKSLFVTRRNGRFYFKDLRHWRNTTSTRRPR